ncbi:MAG: MmcB family DNA repair protein [Alphaproteobacteria bacterium]|nr:MmcB family DNA repair protein [Alphaproteobacteria bacterium]
MDGEWSLNAPAVARGVQRCLYALGYAPLTEFVLPDGARLDVAALGPSGDIVAVEIKVSAADLRADRKWPGYLDFCERFYFAIPLGFDAALVPEAPGLIVADRYGAEIVRESPVRPLNAARRKALTLSFARVAAARMLRGLDPDAALLPP